MIFLLIEIKSSH